MDELKSHYITRRKRFAVIFRPALQVAKRTSIWKFIKKHVAEIALTGTVIFQEVQIQNIQEGNRDEVNEVLQHIVQLTRHAYNDTIQKINEVNGMQEINKIVIERQHAITTIVERHQRLQKIDNHPEKIEDEINSQLPLHLKLSHTKWTKTIALENNTVVVTYTIPTIRQEKLKRFAIINIPDDNSMIQLDAENSLLIVVAYNSSDGVISLTTGSAQSVNQIDNQPFNARYQSRRWTM